MKSNRDKRSALKWLALAAIVGSMGLGGCDFGWDEDGVYKEFNDTFDVDSPEQFDLSNNACAQMIRDDIINDTNRFSFVTEEVKLEFNACSKHNDEHVSDDNGDTDNDETSHAPDPTEPADPPSSDDNNGGVGANKNAKFNECEEGILRGLFEKNGFCKGFIFKEDSNEENSKYNFVVREIIDNSERIICESDDSVACRYKQCPKEYTLVSDYKLENSKKADDYACVKSTCGGVIVDLQTDSKNCGKCEKVCGEGDKCEGGECVPADTSKVYCNGKYIDPLNDNTYCGATPGGLCTTDTKGDKDYKGQTCESGYSCQGGVCKQGCAGGQVLCDGKCITPEDDMIYCGASGDCTGNNRGKTCLSGTSCQDGICKAGCIDGQLLCDNKCITPEKDMIYCGASGDCTGDNKGKTCLSGTSCQDGVCKAGCIDGQLLCDGKCITPETDMIYCGASGDCTGDNKGKSCPSGESCQDRTCQPGCVSGQVLCDGKCITPGTDMIYCGASGDCSGKNKGTTCPSGESCQGGTCKPGCIDGQLLCDGKCITPGTDMIYCGASGDCTGKNKGTTCPSGTSCQGGTCEAGCIDGQVLCGGKCITPGTDMIYCGASGDCSGKNKGTTCPSGTSCQGGTCKAGCIDGQVLCGGKCITPGTDMIYCGASGDCSGRNKGTTCPSGTSCQGGTCEAGCVSGQLLCDNKCITPGTDMNFCGASGNCTGDDKGTTCPSGTSCQGGTCEAGCVSGQVLCDGKCITPGTDMIYCGASGDCSGQNKGKTCPSGTSCQGGTCEAGCVSGQVLCDGKCITPGTDMIYCGASGDCSGQNKGRTCPSGTSCQGGTCEAGCIDGQLLCDGKCITPGTDMIYCGASGDCSGQNKGTTCPSGTSCQGGTCEAGCVSGQVLCDGKCITPGTDMIYCGASGDCTGDNKGKTCPSGTSCQGGTCEAGCVSGQVLCNGKCVTPDTDINNCGSCGNVCLEKIANSSAVECNGGNCSVKTCSKGYVLNQAKDACIVSTSLDCCGKDCLVCQNISGWKEGTCSTDADGNGKCSVTACIAGYVAQNGKCVGSGCTNDFVCTGATNRCENGQCVCGSGGVCEGDSPYCGGETGAKEATCVECTEENHCATQKADSYQCDQETHTCSITCFPGYYYDQRQCKQNDNNNCGSKGWSCTANASEGESKVICKSGTNDCEVKECTPGFYLDNGKCNANNDENCRGVGIACTKDDVSHASDVTCFNKATCEATACEEGFYLYDGECKSNDNENCGKKGETCTTGTIEKATKVTCVGKTQCEVVECGGGTIVSTSRDKCVNCQNDEDCGSGYFACRDSKCKIDISYAYKSGNYQTVSACWRDETDASLCRK